MFVKIAKNNGIKVPENPNNFDKDQFPHFEVLLNFLLGKSVDIGQNDQIAKIIANLSEDKIRVTSYDELIDLIEKSHD